MSTQEIKFDDAALDELRERVRQYRISHQVSFKTLGAKIGMGESTLHAFTSNIYKGDVQAKAAEIAKWFKTEETQELFGNTFVKPPFQMTSTAKYIFSMLTFAKMGNMVTLVGNPGVGKTSAFDEYTRQNSNVWTVTCSPSSASWAGFFEALLDEMGSPNSGRHGHILSQRSRKYLADRHTPLVIIDESQFIGERILEEMRFIHDKIGCGVMLAGNYEVSGRVDGNRNGPFAQRSSRIGKRGDLKGPMGQDVEIMLGAWGITDAIEFKFLRSIAMVPGGGALRTMSKVLEQATLVANARNEPRTILHIKDAADDLNAGLAA